MLYLISRRHSIRFGNQSIFESFLQERSLKVVLDGQFSYLCMINAGVPQGEFLETILFQVFINDLPDEVL